MKTKMLLVLGFSSVVLCLAESKMFEDENLAAANYLIDLVTKADRAVKRGIPCKCSDRSDVLDGEQSYIGGDCGKGWKKCKIVNALSNCCQRE
ncbi:delta-aiptatoxin-Adi1a [Exaiptasia diaphana]|uniref:Uncharacterized protein n=1 Tax=Exaiptasia diaphana TaxID=2652724 RepID=A0A913YM11_EXADI|nr:delta-aiptatoxin-Adi1a [Exaiptasia diaphana]